MLGVAAGARHTAWLDAGKTRAWGAGGAALVYGGNAWRGVFPNGVALGWCGRALFAVVSLLYGGFALFGAWLLLLAPLQLSGAVHGLAPPCDARYLLDLDRLFDTSCIFGQ